MKEIKFTDYHKKWNKETKAGVKLMQEQPLTYKEILENHANYMSQLPKRKKRTY